MPAGGRFAYELVGRVTPPAIVLKNCAYYYIPGSGPIVSASGPLSCVEVKVNPLPGHSMQAGKTIYNPSTNLARVGDPIGMSTWARNTGSITGTTPILLDRLAAGCVQYDDGAPFNTWYEDFSWWHTPFLFCPSCTLGMGSSPILRAAAPCAAGGQRGAMGNQVARRDARDSDCHDYVYIQAEPIAEQPARRERAHRAGRRRRHQRHARLSGLHQQPGECDPRQSDRPGHLRRRLHDLPERLHPAQEHHVQRR